MVYTLQQMDSVQAHLSHRSEIIIFSILMGKLRLFILTGYFWLLASTYAQNTCFP